MTWEPMKPHHPEAETAGSPPPGSAESRRLGERIALQILVLLLWSSQASPAETVYYVAPTGSNAHSCRAAQSASTPKQTFASAWGCLSPGDVLIVRSGIYSQEITPPPGKAGTAAKPITSAPRRTARP